MTDRRQFLKLGGLASVVGSASLAGLIPAQALAGAFPSKPIEWIVPFSPGGGADRWSRILSSVALDVLDQPLQIRNIPGASGTKGWQEMLTQPADGHTTLIASPTPIIELMKSTAPLVDPRRVKIVCFISAFNAILFTRPNKPWSTWAGLVDYARDNPGKLRFGMTFSELVGTALSLKGAGLEAKLIPYTSTSTAVTDMLGGTIDITAGTPSTALSFVPNQATALLNATQRPLPEDVNAQLGNPPHAVEFGYDAMNFPRWIGVHPETPDDVVAELSSRIGAMLSHESLIQMMRRLGEEIIFVPHDQAQIQYNALLNGVESVIDTIKA